MSWFGLLERESVQRDRVSSRVKWEPTGVGSGPGSSAE